MWHFITKKIRNDFHPLFMLRKNKLLSRILLSLFDVQVSRRLLGIRHKIYLHLVRNLSTIINPRLSEPGLTALFKALSFQVNPRTFWDVGANIGIYSWFMMDLNDELQAVLFEPDPKNIAIIERTILEAELKKSTLVKCAVSNKSGRSSFTLDEVSGATGSLVIQNTFTESMFGYKPRRIDVDTTTLDEIWEKKGFAPPDLIKIDVEMAEHLVIEGAEKLLMEKRPVVIFECADNNRNNLIASFKKLDYQILGADFPGAEIESSENLLALPIRYQNFFEELMVAWRYEYARWR